MIKNKGSHKIKFQTFEIFEIMNQCVQTMEYLRQNDQYFYEINPQSILVEKK